MGNAQTSARTVDVMTAAIGCPKAVPLGEKVAFLTAMPGVVQVIETHMAFVFLTAGLAFKLKKPVSFGYFDHQTLAARAIACSEEVRLNRALAGDVYLGTVPLVLAGTQLALGGDGQVVDWLVRMRRLPAERMLDATILARQASSPSQAGVAAVVAHLAGFYRHQQMSPPPAGLYLAHLQREQAVNSQNLRQMARYLPDTPLALVTTGVENRIAGMGPEILARETAGLVIEGHGDLRPEHVCLTEPVVIFDRVEAALELRVIDVFDEVGYLAAECTLLGRRDLGERLMRGMAEAGFARPSPDLQTTYAMFRLVTRARLALDHLRDPFPTTPDKWPARARAYLAEALRLSRIVPGRRGG
jgi:aminoglycoside phosphotransferase family enzyme